MVVMVGLLLLVFMVASSGVVVGSYDNYDGVVVVVCVLVSCLDWSGLVSSH